MNDEDEILGQPDDVSEDDEDQKIFVGFHQLGGIRLSAGEVRLEPNEAFVLAGQLVAHATMIINFGYMAQAQAQEELLATQRSIIKPPGVR